MKSMVKKVGEVEAIMNGLYYATTVANLREGEFFVLNESSINTEGYAKSESVVWVRGEYERSEKKYSCTKFVDVCHESFLKADTVVYFGFTF